MSLGLAKAICYHCHWAGLWEQAAHIQCQQGSLCEEFVGVGPSVGFGLIWVGQNFVGFCGQILTKFGVSIFCQNFI